MRRAAEVGTLGTLLLYRPYTRTHANAPYVASVPSVPNAASLAGAAHGEYEKLIAAIRTCCAVRGDDAANVEALIREVPDYDTEAQRDLIEHFVNEAAIWRRATGAAS